MSSPFKLVELAEFEIAELEISELELKELGIDEKEVVTNKELWVEEFVGVEFCSALDEERVSRLLDEVLVVTELTSDSLSKEELALLDASILEIVELAAVLEGMGDSLGLELEGFEGLPPPPPPHAVNASNKMKLVKIFAVKAVFSLVKKFSMSYPK